MAGQTVTAAGLGGPTRRCGCGPTCSGRPACRSTTARYLSFIPSAPTKAAAGFDMLVGASSVYGGSWLEGSGAVYAENQALRWIADLAGLPEEAGGAFVQGGTVGNLSALVAAREAALHRRGGERPARWAVCVTEETHSSVKHALRVVMDVDVVEVPGDERGRMLAAALRGYRRRAARGFARRRSSPSWPPPARRTSASSTTSPASRRSRPSTAGGCTSTAPTAAPGWPRPSVRHLFAGVEHADSFIVDPHKWLFAPFDACALVYRDPVLARAAHTQHAGYLDPVTVEGEWNPSDFAIQLTRRARGLPFWFSLAVHGTDAYRDALEQTLTVARAGARADQRSPNTCGCWSSPTSPSSSSNGSAGPTSTTTRWTARLLDEQIAFVTPTKHRGRVCTRFAIVNPLTTADDLALIIDSMR